MEAINYQDPKHMVNYLSGFITDASKITAHVANEFGRDKVPHKFIDETLRKARERDAKERALREAEKALERDTDALDWQVRRINVKRDRRGPGYKYEPVSVTLAPKKPHKPLLLGPISRKIIDSTAEAFGLQPEVLLSGSRKTQHVCARFVAMRLFRDIMRSDGEHRFSLPQIGKIMGGKDHSSVCHAMQVFEAKCRRFPAMREAYESLSAGMADNAA